METLIEKVTQYVDMALELGDLRTAQKLTWLKNNMENSDISKEDALLQLVDITVFAGRPQ